MIERAGVIATLARWHAYHRRDRDEWRARLATAQTATSADTSLELARRAESALTALYSVSEDLGMSQDVYNASLKLYEGIAQ